MRILAANHQAFFPTCCILTCLACHLFKNAGTSKTSAPPLTRSGSSTETTGSDHGAGPAASAHARRKSVSHTASSVVTVDMIQADWEAKLAAVRATAARRAARRVVFRQVGERLVPVGISSGRELNPNTTMIDDQGRIILTGPIPIVGQSGYSRSSIEAANAAAAAGGIAGSGAGDASPSRLLGRATRRARGQSASTAADAEGQRILGMGGDLEELMVMEAMRLSMVDEEERRKKAEKDAKKKEKSYGGSSSSGAKRLLGAVTGSSSRGGDGEGSKQGAAAGSSGRSSPRVSFDQPRLQQQQQDTPRASTESSRAAAAGLSSSSATVGSNNPYAASSSGSSRIGGNSKSSFLRMPPMQRNDSSASMTTHNLPPPLVPTQAANKPSEGARSQPQMSRQDARRLEEELL